MKKITLLFIFVSTVGAVEAQNLIPNGDLEAYSTCPDDISQLEHALNWITPTEGTSDYFNQCTNYAAIDVPNNLVGYQAAHSGVGYAGIFMFDIIFGYSLHYREYLEVPLTSVLVNNNCYHFEMYISLANTSAYSVSNIEVYFSDTVISNVPSDAPLSVVPQIINTTGQISDTLNWTLISGNYNAQGGESYLIIGNFNEDDFTDTLLVNQNAGPEKYAYYYVDDVSLSVCTGINNSNTENRSWSISPNLVSDNLQISGSIQSSEAEINLIDVTGRICFHKNIFSKGDFAVDLNVNDFSEGIYILNLKDGSKMYSEKIVIGR